MGRITAYLGWLSTYTTFNQTITSTLCTLNGTSMCKAHTGVRREVAKMRSNTLTQAHEADATIRYAWPEKQI